MKRKLKFRAWDKDNRKMYKVDIDNGCFAYISPSGIDHLSPERTLVMMQYVGFDDVNGNEIFEGDIDQFGYVVTYLADLNEGYGMDAGWYLQRDDFEAWSHLECNNNIEIIGNVFENPKNTCGYQSTNYAIILGCDVVSGVFNI